MNYIKCLKNLFETINTKLKEIIKCIKAKIKKLVVKNKSFSKLQNQQSTITIKSSKCTQNTPNTCIGTDADLKIPFCCSTTIPKDFIPPDLNNPNTNKRLIYTLDCLNYIFEKCKLSFETQFGKITIPGHQVKIVGCIPFMTSLFPVMGDCGGRYDANDNPIKCDSKVAICCQGYVCVNENIGCILDKEYPSKKRCPDFDCVSITATLNITIEKCNNSDAHIVKFIGEFTIPPCKITKH